ncbi:IS66 family transposase [Clostridium folliculivorans]|uniref:IS66 family transposase n=1 Tax=Clostridium folliculivorans TaxID=2886038 RepID=UPI0021C44EB0|nr:IS66 family transposase [Clostridium folliculivorans]GKU29330.1 hypothetical protein CFB3_14360 [Clostridium folliculivorans]
MNGMPLYRQEQSWLQRDFKLSRSTMANWVIRCSSDWLKPVYDLIKAELVKCETLHAHEIRIQCNKEPSKKDSSESFMWLYRSGKYEQKDIVLLEYIRTIEGKQTKLFLKGFSGKLISGTYTGYDKVENIIRFLCWSHIKRYFIESIRLNNGKEIPGSKGAEDKDFCDRLFKVKKIYRHFSPKKDLFIARRKANLFLTIFGVSLKSPDL